MATASYNFLRGTVDIHKLLKNFVQYVQNLKKLPKRFYYVCVSGHYMGRQPSNRLLNEFK